MENKKYKGSKLASITDAIKKAAQATSNDAPAPRVTVADTSNLTANSSSGAVA